MPLRPCLGVYGQSCNRLSPNRRCPACQTEYDQRREASRPTSQQRYGGGHKTAAARFVEAETKAGRGHCAWCGHFGDSDNPLTAGHIIARSRGGKSTPDNFRVECRSCNSSRGDRYG